MPRRNSSDAGCGTPAAEDLVPAAGRRTAYAGLRRTTPDYAGR
ncbi:hypothetical protein [Myceligenerans halotolerans]